MEEIEKYIRENLKGKKDIPGIKQNLASQGYNPEDYDALFSEVLDEKKGRKKYYLLLAIIVIVAVLLRFFLINPITENATGPVKSAEALYTGIGPKFSTDPKEWVTKDSLDIVAATNGSAQLYSDSLQYLQGSIATAFTYSGAYHGKSFSWNYTENNMTFIEITNKLNSTDGIPQAIIVEKLDQVTGESEALIFVDEDWKSKIVPTYIWWGANFENSRIFDFSHEIIPGIYMDSVNDSSRFASNFNLHQGGVAIGDITQEKIDSGSNDTTYVMIQ